MARDGRGTAAAVSAAFTSSLEQRYATPQPRRWKGARYWCFGFYPRRDKRIVPVARPHGGADSSRGWLPVRAVLALVPPSSPASLGNLSDRSPMDSSANSCCLVPPSSVFMTGPYAHETQLVSPPVFSTLTTEPSTATVTPPPELAHHAAASFPDVPLAQYIASLLEAKAAAAAREAISPLCTSAMASPCDTPASYTSYHYLGSPVSWLISPAVENSAKAYAASDHTSSFPPFDSYALPDFSPSPLATLILPCDSNPNAEEPVTPVVSAIPNREDPPGLDIISLPDMHTCQSFVNLKQRAGLFVGTEKEMRNSSLQQETSMGGLLSKIHERFRV